MRFNRFFLAILGTFWLVSGAFAAELEDLDMPNPRNPEKTVLVGGQPSESDLEKLAGEGYSIVINLRRPGEFDGFDEAMVVETLGMKYINIPVNGLGDLTPENAALLHEALEDAGGQAFVHCASGRRAGGLMGVEKYLFHEFSPEGAIDFAVKANTIALRDPVQEALEQLKK